MPRIVGITGGIGSGKSVVCDAFAGLGIPVFDADIAAREVVLPGSPLLDDVVAEFGANVLNADGELDRRALRDLVFSSDTRRRALERLLHPAIRARLAAQIARCESDYCLLCIPLLVEKGGYEDIERILVVDCDPALQRSRVAVRDNLTPDEVGAIMRTQATREQRLAAADDIIENNGDLDAVR
ncbi:MAG: dephospho-CoA kinase, partial [Gammaproteobacteria bacterium]|nr:dephospho-CoA kinase [Gammaproteobacteria bacterium]